MLSPNEWSGVFVIVGLLALATILAILATAPSLAAGVDRLKLVLNTLGLVIIAIALPLGVGMFVWGFAVHDKALIYFSFIPLVASVATYRAITRRHRTWYGILLGVDDSRETWSSFWNETLRVWGVRARDRASPGRDRAAAGTAGEAQSHTFSFSLDIPAGRAPWLSSLIKFAAHRLDTAEITVFPNALHIAVALGDTKEASHLRGFRQSLSVRRADGGPLKLKARTDVPFLELVVGLRQPDGSYEIAVRLKPQRLTKGAFKGEIRIETGDHAMPVLTVPVSAMIT